MVNETIYAVDINLVDKTGSASVAEGQNDYLKQTADGIGEMRRVFTKPGSIFSMPVGAGGAGGALGGLAGTVGMALGGLVLSEIAANIADRKISDFTGVDGVGHEIRDWVFSLSQGVEGAIGKVIGDLMDEDDNDLVDRVKNWVSDLFGSVREGLIDAVKVEKSTVYNPDGTTAENIFAIDDAAGNPRKKGSSVDLSRAQEEVNSILKDSVVTQEEMVRLQEIEQQLLSEKRSTQEELSGLSSLESSHAYELMSRRSQTLSVLMQIGEAQKLTNQLTQSNIANINATNAALDKQLQKLKAIAKAKDAKGRTVATVTSSNGETLGEYTGQTFTPAQAQQLGYGGAMGQGSSGVFIGVRTVA